ncbi:MAG: efflux RND transporter periplasmic adaptor subunit [Myxococcota bacterium]
MSTVRFSPWSTFAMAMLALVPLSALGACDGEQQEQRGPQAQPVTTAIVKVDTLRETVRGIGSLQALEQVAVSPETNGIVRKVGFEEGTFVRDGQVLFRIDSKMLDRQLGAQLAALSAARAQLTHARSTMQRRAQLLAEGVITPAEYQAALTQLQQAEAEVQRLEAQAGLVREQIADTVIRAPLAGIISESSIDPGTFVRAGQHLATVYQSSPLEVEFTVPERHAPRLGPGQLVDLTLTSVPDKRFEGRITYVSPSVTEATRDIVVKAQIDDPPKPLKPGMFATVVVTLETREGQAVIPEEALVGTRKGYMVFVVRDGTAHRRDVQIGLRKPGWVAIRKGLEQGEVVVRTGHISIEDGTEVKVVEPDAGADAAGPADAAGAAGATGAARDGSTGAR